MPLEQTSPQRGGAEQQLQGPPHLFLGPHPPGTHLAEAQAPSRSPLASTPSLGPTGIVRTFPKSPEPASAKSTWKNLRPGLTATALAEDEDAGQAEPHPR